MIEYSKKMIRPARRVARVTAFVLMLLLGGFTNVAWGQTTYTYYALHNKDKGYLKQYKGIVGNDGNFRFANAYDDNGSSIWVYSSDCYLQQEMYYLNVANDQTLYLSPEKITQWVIDNTTATEIAIINRCWLTVNWL